jgi:hypothetical protein
MKIEIEPTPELYEAPINDVLVPVRIWRGRTSGGVAIEAYILSVTPNDPADSDRLRSELPPFMGRSRDTYKIDTSKP